LVRKILQQIWNNAQIFGAVNGKLVQNTKQSIHFNLIPISSNLILIFNKPCFQFIFLLWPF
jgi:hypothetical protein